MKMDAFDSHPEKITNFRSVAGLVLILAGGALFLDRYLQTGWLSFVVLPSIGLFLYAWGIRFHHQGLILAGGVLGGVGAGSSAIYSQAGSQPAVWTQIGLLAFYTGIGWLAVTAGTALFTSRPQWWTLLPAGAIGGLGACLVFSRQGWGDYVLYISMGVGAAFLLWAFAVRLFGLAIPGCLIIGAGLGTYIGWYAPGIESNLVRTGIMLVWFALGWGLITLSGRVILQRYIWWPLIPGGILAMVGWGLYIGGDPDNALGFISNTGSIALMIFGLYLLLMRKGIHH